MTKLQEFLRQYDKKATIKTFNWVLGVFVKSIYGDKKDLGLKLDQYLSEKRDYQKDVENFHILLNGKPVLRTQRTAKNLFLCTRRTQCTAPTILTDFFNKYLVNIRGRVRSVRGVSGLWSG